MNKLNWILLGFVAAASVAVGILVPDHDIHQRWWNNIPGFYALFGFVGCLILILVAKSIGNLFLYKREDYYDAD